LGIILSANWISSLSIDPIPSLTGTNDEALVYFTQRDLLGTHVLTVDTLWKLPNAVRLAKKQRPDGSWKHSGSSDPSVPGQNYSLLETFRNLRVLVEMYGFNRNHPVIEKAAEYILGCQTDEGDIRGIIGNQYMPYYHGAFLELLIKAGYENDPRVISGLDWLLTVRQDDGGWIVPTQAIPTADRTNEFWSGKPVPPDRSRPHSHMATGMVLRCFAAHPSYSKQPDILLAAKRLKERILEADKYNDRRETSYWLKFQFPFWWTNLVSALDTLSLLGLPGDDPHIYRGLEWLIENQQNEGFWPTGYDKGIRSQSNQNWVGLAICRILHRYFP
jgi:hypothetical protein